MRRKGIAAVLIFCLLAQSLIGWNQVAAKQEESSSRWKSIYQSLALQDFLVQIGERFDDKEQVTALIEVSEEYINQKWGMESADKEELSTPFGIEKQQHYNRQSQEYLLQEINAQGLEVEVMHHFEVVFNGLEVVADIETLKQIAMLKAVKSITYDEEFRMPTREEVRRYRRSMIQLDEIQSDHSTLYRGKNQLIAVIDTGVDINHEIFASHNPADNKIANQAVLNALKKKNNIAYGAWNSDKIPFIYNYVDKNTSVLDLDSSSHGMHVAGIAVANSNRLKGVAPDAQIAVLKVFSNGKNTSVKIFTRALEDAVKLGADSINMSLGTPGGAERNIYRPTLAALENARRAGIVVSVATGNDGFLGWEENNRNRPNADNPDYGLLGSPAVAKDALAVASVNNSEIFGRYLEVEGRDKKIAYQPTTYGEDSSDYFGYIDGGYGTKEELAKIASDAALKYVLVQRGDKPDGKVGLTYAEKAENAKEVKAAGIIIYNNQEKASLIEMDMGGVRLPAVSITKEDGEYLKSLLAVNSNVRFRFSQTAGLVENPDGYRPSDFSSWGVTPEGNLKPDISAPGGRIYSSFNNNRYGVLDGTSMAAPSVAGGVVIVKEYVERQFPHLSNQEKHKLIQNLLMSTAKPYGDQPDIYYSPRKQGAGLMQLKNAVSATVILEGTTGASSITLGQLEGNEVVVEGFLHNYGSDTQEFTYHAVLHTDSVEGEKITLKPRFLKKSEEAKISVGAGEKKEFSVRLELPESVITQLENEMPSGFFLEGFVFFMQKEDGSGNAHPNINIPFTGFRGDWGAIPVVEKSVYDILKEGKRPVYFNKSITAPAFTHLGSTVKGSQTGNSKEVVLGGLADSDFFHPKMEADKIAFSPNGDEDADYVQFYGTFLRDYSSFTIQVYETTKDGQRGAKVYEISEKTPNGVRNIPHRSGAVYTKTNPDWRWRGHNYKGSVVSDGNYQMQITVKSLAQSQTVQNITFPVKVDTVAPLLRKVTYQRDTRHFTLNQIVETGSGIYRAYIIYNPALGEKSDGNVSELRLNERTTLKENFDESMAKLVLIDFAYNRSEISFQEALARDGRKSRLEVQTETDLFESGEVTWEVYSKASGQKITDFANMEAGEYTLLVTKYDSNNYRLLSGESMDFVIQEDELVKTVIIKLKYIQRDNTKPKPPVEEMPTPKPPVGNVPDVNPPSGNQQTPKAPSGNQEAPKPPIGNVSVPKPAPSVSKPERMNNRVIEQKSYMKGAGDGYFYPDRRLTRAEIAVMLNRFIGSTATSKPNLKDIEGNQWYTSAVENLLQNGIVSGYPDGSYRPLHSLSRAELIVLIARVKGYQPVSSSEQVFSDINDALWAKEYIFYAVQQGWMKGYPDGTIRPNREVSRAEAVVLINRAFGFQSIGEQKVSFPDVDENHWAYREIMIATGK